MEIERIKEKNSLHTFKDSIQNIDGLTRTGVLYVREIFFLPVGGIKPVHT